MRRLSNYIDKHFWIPSWVNVARGINTHQFRSPNLMDYLDVYVVDVPLIEHPTCPNGTHLMLKRSTVEIVWIENRATRFRFILMAVWSEQGSTKAAALCCILHICDNNCMLILLFHLSYSLWFLLSMRFFFFFFTLINVKGRVQGREGLLLFFFWNHKLKRNFNEGQFARLIGGFAVKWN